MLPDSNLDTENFNDIVEEAKNKITGLYPEWTDYNYHDPGITLIELFAWLKEIQQFYLNQIGEQHKLSYLNLYGMKRLHKQCAIARVDVNTKNDLILPAGTRLYAGSICFETQVRETLVGGNMSMCIAKQKDTYVVVDRQQLGLKRKLKLHIFGKKPAVGNEFYIGFDQVLPTGIPLSIYFNVFDNYETPRNPIGQNEFYPLARLSYEYYTIEGWKKFDIRQEETFQFIQDGSIHFILQETMGLTVVCQEEGYFLRVSLLENNYDVPPLLERISINMVSVMQQETLSECYDFPVGPGQTVEVMLDSWLALHGRAVIYIGHGGYYYELTDFVRKMDMENKRVQYSSPLPRDGNEKPDSVRIACFTEEYYDKRIVGIGDGLPNQEFDFEDRDMEYDAFRILVVDIECKGSFYEWKKVSDFHGSTPMDKHYVLEEEKGILRFGDCIHGMAPEGEIRIISYARTQGSGGNVKSGAVQGFGESDYQSAEVFNEDNAYGGRNTESMEECFLRLKKELKEIVRGITNEDYETLVYQTPGLMIRECKAIPATDSSYGDVKENLISIVVRPFSMEKEPKVSAVYDKNITAFLNRRRMIGTKVKVLSPQYVHLTLFVEAKLKVHYIDAKTIVRSSIEKYFKASAWRFGSPVIYGGIYGMIDTLACVAEVNSLTIDARGDGVVRKSNGDVWIPPNGLVLLKNVQCIFVSGGEE